MGGITEIANHINQTYRAPLRPDIERAKYGNALMRGNVALQQQEIAAEPDRAKMRQLGIQGAEQNQRLDREQFGDQQKANARGILSQRFAAVAQSQNPVAAYQQLLNDPDFKAAGSMLGIPLDQFTFDGKETPEQIQSGMMDWARATGAQVEQQKPQTTYGDPYQMDGATVQKDSTGQVHRVLDRPGQQPTPAKPQEPPNGYMWANAERTALNFVPGGPYDPNGPNTRRNAMPLRKEFEDSPTVSQYRTVLPLYERAATAPDNRAGDISVIYALGKMFDPTSVVREGELQLSMNAAPWLQKFAAEANSQVTGEGRLTPALRAQIMESLNGQVQALAQPYQQERQRYSQYATDSGFDPNQVVGPDPAAAFSSRQQQQPQAQGNAGGGNVAPEGTIVSNGQQQLIKRNGKWEPYGG